MRLARSRLPHELVAVRDERSPLDRYGLGTERDLNAHSRIGRGGDACSIRPDRGASWSTGIEDGTGYDGSNARHRQGVEWRWFRLASGSGWAGRGLAAGLRPFEP